MIRASWSDGTENINHQTLSGGVPVSDGKDFGMMKEQIGQTAGRIWAVLGDKEEIGLEQLPRVLKAKSDITYQALGWLAREDKVTYRTKAGKVYISLSDKEREFPKS